MGGDSHDAIGDVVKLREGFWLRAMAAVLDWVVLGAIAIAVTLFVQAVIYPRWYHDPGFVERILSALFAAAVLVYTSLEIFVGATLGKLVLGMRIRKQDASRADFWTLFLRWNTKYWPQLANLLAAIFGVLLLDWLASWEQFVITVGCLHVCRASKLAWHDEWAGTAVYRRGATHPPPLPAG